MSKHLFRVKAGRSMTGCAHTGILWQDTHECYPSTYLKPFPLISKFHWGGVIIQWGHPKVKTKVHHPPNLIPMIDIRCFAKRTTYFRPKKSGAPAILHFWFFGFFGQLECNGGVSHPFDDLCSWYLDFCDDHLSWHPNRDNGTAMEVDWEGFPDEI